MNMTCIRMCCQAGYLQKIPQLQVLCVPATYAHSHKCNTTLDEHICLFLYKQICFLAHYSSLEFSWPDVSRTVVFVRTKAHPSRTKNGAVSVWKDGCIVCLNSMSLPFVNLRNNSLAVTKYAMRNGCNTYCAAVPPAI